MAAKFTVKYSLPIPSQVFCCIKYVAILTYFFQTYSTKAEIFDVKSILVISFIMDILMLFYIACHYLKTVLIDSHEKGTKTTDIKGVFCVIFIISFFAILAGRMSLKSTCPEFYSSFESFAIFGGILILCNYVFALMVNNALSAENTK